MATAVLLPNGKQTFLDGNGEPLAGGSVYFYIPNTTTFKNTWQDPLEQTLNTNPVTLDSAGTAVVYGEGQYRQLVKDSSGNTIWDNLTSSPPVIGPQATLSSASTTDLGSTNVNVIEITGTTTINSFGSSADVNVPIYFLTFTGILALTYNATSMQLPGATNITTAAGDTAEAQYLGSGNWLVRNYLRANGQALVVSSGVPVLLNTLTANNSASLADTTSLTSAYKSYEIRIINILPASATQNFVMRFSTNGGSSYDSGSNYSWAGGALANMASIGVTGTTSIVLNDSGHGVSNSASLNGISGTIDLFNPASSNDLVVKYQTSHFISGGTSMTGNVSAGSYFGGAPVNAVQFVFGTGNITSGTIEIWGRP